MFRLLLSYSVFITVTQAFYLPGQSPVYFCSPDKAKDGTCGSKIEVLVNRLSSINSLLNFDYGKFDTCRPEHVRHPRENLGQVVFGDRISNSPYTMTFGNASKCVFVCRREYALGDASALDKLNFLVDSIKKDYMHYWIIDNMPVTWCVDANSLSTSFGVQCYTGFPLGCHVTDGGTAMDACKIYETLKKPGSVYLFNHVDVTLTHRTEKDGRSLLVAAKVTPRSIQHPAAGDAVDCWNPKLPPVDLTARPDKAPLVVKYSYSIEFKERHDLKWSSRWDYILNSVDDRSIHWLSITNSLIICILLSAIFAVILLQTLRRDIALINDEVPGDGSLGIGWKSLSYDVFRAPKHRMFLSATVGFGCQLVLVLLFTVAVACGGVLSPASRGALATFVLVVYVCMGGVAGYVSAIIYKMYGGSNPKTNVLMTGIFFPGVVFGILFLLNLVLWMSGSSSAVPFTTLLSLLFMISCVSAPLVFFGAYFGFKQPAVEAPVHVNSAELHLSGNTVAYFRCLVGGLMPFVVLFVPLFFIFTSIWSSRFYYLFGFLLMVVILFVVTSAETAILLCYLQLSSGDYRWCWTSFLSSASVSLYFFIYSIYYYLHNLHMDDSTSTVLYLGYTLTLSLLVFAAAGSIGWVACLLFVRKIYSCIKLD